MPWSSPSMTAAAKTEPASGPLPVDPIAPGTRRELSEDDRVYVGAWTRLVVRRATPEEQ